MRKPLSVAVLLVLSAVLAAGCAYSPPFVITVPGTYHIDNTNELFRSPVLRVAVCLDAPSSVEGSVSEVGGKGLPFGVELEWNGVVHPLGGDPTPVLQPGCGELRTVPTCCAIPDGWVVTLRGV